LQGVFTNILNHSQLLDPVGTMGLFGAGTFGSLASVDSNNSAVAKAREIEVGARVRF